MTNTKAKFEAVLDAARRALAAATSAPAILAAGNDLPALIADIDAACDTIDDDIAKEAESIDRKRANTLRADRAALADLVTDAEYLQRRIDEKHKAMLKSETEAAMQARHASALVKQAEAKAIVVKLAAPLQQVVSAVAAYQALDAEMRAINDQLRAGDRNDLCVRPPLHSVTREGERLGGLFDFAQGGRLLMPGDSGPNLLAVAERLKAEGAGK